MTQPVRTDAPAHLQTAVPVAGSTTPAGTVPVPATRTGAAAPLDDVVVRLDTGRGGLPRVVVTTPTAHAEIYLQGAHVTAWAPAGEPTVVWTGAHSAFAAGEPIRGGVPVCFPWFGPHPTGDGPLHGLVRARPWTLAGWTQQGDDVVLTFTLAASGSDACGGRFALRYTVTVGARLTLALEVSSTGTGPLRFEEALHTYLAVRDLREATILGLGDLDRLDRLTGHRTRTPAGAELHVVGETDHLYSRPGAVTVVDWEGQRSVRVGSHGSANTVVWNPWAAKAAAMPDLGEDEWSQLVCVETCNVADAAIVLPPGETHTMAMTLDVGPLP